MSAPGTKLTVYFGEGDRLDHQFLSERLLDVFGAHALRASMLARGVEGFGIKHARRTDRLLTLSEDLPLVAAGVDSLDVVERMADDLSRLPIEGLVTLERARLLDVGDGSEGLEDLGDTVKLTAYLERGSCAGGRPAHEMAVRVMREAGVEGATVMLGVDGTLRGRRRRARFLSLNAEAPLAVVAVGALEPMRRALVGLRRLPAPVVITAERARVLKRDGEVLGDLPAIEPGGTLGPRPQLKLTLYASEQTRFEGRPVHIEAVERLRREGAPGATTLRGVWGYHGDHEPHGDRLLAVRRRVPTMTVAVGDPREGPRRLATLDALTPSRGLITAETVPAIQLAGEGSPLRLPGR